MSEPGQERRDGPFAKSFWELAHAGIAHRRASVAALLILLVVASVGMLGLELDGNTASLLPASDPSALAYRRATARFGELNPLVAEIRFTNVSRKKADAELGRLRQQLSGWEDMGRVELLPTYRVPETGKRLRAALWNGPKEARRQFFRQLTPDGIHRQLLRTRKRLLAIADPRVREEMVRDPLSLRQTLGGFYSGRGLPGTQDLATFPSLLILHPTGSAEDGIYCQRLLERLRTAIGVAARNLGSNVSAKVRIAGAHALTAQTSSLLQADLIRISLVAALMLLTLMATVLRDVRSLLLIAVPLLISQLVLLALARWLCQPLHYLTLGCVAIVLGIGIDNGLHLIGRLGQILEHLDLHHAIQATLADCGPPLVIGAITSAVAFLTLTASRSPGLVELGALTAGGLVLSLLLSLLSFPALAALLKPRGINLSRGRVASALRFPASRAGRRPRLAAALGTALLLAGIAAARDLPFRHGIENLLPKNLPAIADAQQIASNRGLPLGSQLLVTVNGVSWQEATRTQSRLDLLLERMVERGEVALFRSPSELIAFPGSGDGQAPPNAQLRSVRRDVEAQAAKLGIRLGKGWEESLDWLAEAIVPPNQEVEPDPDLLHEAGLRATRDGDGYHLMTLVSPPLGPGGWSDPRPLLKVRDTLDRSFGDGQGKLEMAGLLPVYLKVNEIVRQDLARVGALAAFAIAMLVLLSFRSIPLAFASFLPVLLAVPMTAGGLSALHISIDPFSLCFAAVILGIGIDDAIHIVWRLQTVPGGITLLMDEIGPLITLTTLTTVLGFGALAISRLPVLATMGLTVAIGVISCWLTTILGMPLLGSYLARGRQSRASSAIALLVCISLGTIAPLRAKDASRTIRELSKRAARLKAVSVEFREIRSLPELTDEVDLDGHLFFQPPRSFEIQLRGRENLDLVSNGSTLWWIDLDLHEIERMNLRQGPILQRRFPLLLLLAPEELGAQLTVSEQEAADGAHRLELRPRQSAGSWPFSRISVRLDHEYRMVWMRSEQRDGSWFEQWFNHWRGAKPRPASQFSVPESPTLDWWKKRLLTK